jgi:hypothetical protein
MDNNDSLKNLYATSEDRMDTILARQHVEFWRKLRKANQEYNIPAWEFKDKMLEDYGIQLNLSTNSAGQDGYEPMANIVDQQKYLLFLLKYTQ